MIKLINENNGIESNPADRNIIETENSNTPQSLPIKVKFGRPEFFHCLIHLLLQNQKNFIYFQQQAQN